MNLDNLLMIPYLSKELNLIGQPTLPYTLEKQCNKNKSGTDDERVKIVFESKTMLETLITICFELVKQNKAQGLNEDSAMDKVNFENGKLEKQLKSCKLEIEKKMNELATEREEKRQLETKLKLLQYQVKDYEKKQKEILLKNHTSEDLLKHSLKKKEAELKELQDFVWKEFNMINKESFPKSYEVIQSNQPNFNKLWSEVKFSNVKNKEEALKKAVCIFQNNNKSLMEDNITLKNLLVTSLKEIHETIQLMCDKMHLPESALPKTKANDIVQDLGQLNVSLYKNTFNEYLNIIKKICDLFEEASFTISDDLFLCWSDILRKF